jgi:hypothetical protein
MTFGESLPSLAAPKQEAARRKRTVTRVWSQNVRFSVTTLSLWYTSCLISAKKPNIVTIHKQEKSAVIQFQSAAHEAELPYAR